MRYIIPGLLIPQQTYVEIKEIIIKKFALEIMRQITRAGNVWYDITPSLSIPIDEIFKQSMKLIIIEAMNNRNNK
uniref:Uncharacterized protein n=1 Tax=viral metagenome TaxID=1070528 RepID=A0A6M3LM33_9ZZZZ